MINMKRKLGAVSKNTIYGRHSRKVINNGLCKKWIIIKALLALIHKWIKILTIQHQERRIGRINNKIFHSIEPILTDIHSQHWNMKTILMLNGNSNMIVNSTWKCSRVKVHLWNNSQHQEPDLYRGKSIWRKPNDIIVIIHKIIRRFVNRPIVLLLKGIALRCNSHPNYLLCVLLPMYPIFPKALDRLSIHKRVEWRIYYLNLIICQLAVQSTDHM